MIQVPVCELLKGSEATDNIDATIRPGDKRDREDERWESRRRANTNTALTSIKHQ